MLTEEELVANLTEEERSLCEAWCLNFSEKLTRIYEKWNKEMEEKGKELAMIYKEWYRVMKEQYRELAKVYEKWNKEMEERKKKER